MTDVEPFTHEQSLEYAFQQETTELLRDQEKLEDLNKRKNPYNRHDRIELMGSIALHFAEVDSILDDHLDYKKDNKAEAEGLQTAA